MQLDWKKIVGALASLLLAGVLGYAAKNGVDVKCPAAPSAVIESK